jgi:hypothetical protein
VHPPPSPARTDFTLITECTPESRSRNSVYSVVQSELLLVIEYTTYMIVTCTQSPLNVSVGILKLVFLFEPMNA